MTDSSNAAVSTNTSAPQQTPKPKDVFIHRVCIQCNNVFRVPADKFDAKQCPNCHKG